MRILTTHLNKRFLKLLPVALIFTLIFSIIGPNTALANPGWYNLSWQHRKKITINAANVSATQTNFPVLINITSDTDLGSAAQLDGDDILFTAADEVTKLSHEIEKFSSNGTAANLTAWVKVPSLSSITDTDIYMYYGNAGATNQQDVTNVWDTNFKMVQHLEETSGGAGTITDSTASHINGTDYNSPTFGVVGLMNGAFAFDGSSGEYVNYGNSSNLSSTGGFTVEAWIYPTDLNADKWILSKVVAPNPQEYFLGMDASGHVSFQIWNGVTWRAATTGNVPSQNTWHHVVGVYDQTRARIYLDGVETNGSTFTGTVAGTAAPLTLGDHVSFDGSYEFAGSIDEVRYSGSARSITWITTSFNNQVNPTSFYTLGPEEDATVTATVTTNDATVVEETIATLNGYLNNDGGEACQYAFEWGTVTGVYTANISWTGPINTGASFSTNLIGLTKGQPYYYRAMAKNSAGVSYGLEVHFLTKPDGPVILTATANSSSQIDLTWTKGTGAQRTMIRRSVGMYPATYLDGIEVYFDTGTSYSDSGLSGNVTYYYRGWSEATGSQQWSNTFVSANATTFAGPVTIGGKVYTVNKAAVLVPWIILGLVGVFILVQIVLYIRKKIHSRPSPHKKTQY